MSLINNIWTCLMNLHCSSLDFIAILDFNILGGSNRISDSRNEFVDKKENYQKRYNVKQIHGL